jgi:hypothetical protein
VPSGLSLTPTHLKEEEEEEEKERRKLRVLKNL